MSDLWDLTGMRVSGLYLNEQRFAVTGTVELSRVAYGGTVRHHVALDEPIEVYGSIRDRVILDHDMIQRVGS